MRRAVARVAAYRVYRIAAAPRTLPVAISFVGCDSTGDSSVRRIRQYEGEHIIVRFEPRRCIHASECVHGLPSVFERDRRPWIDAGAAPAEDIARVVERCPTGALTYERMDGGPAEAVPTRPVIRVQPGGPLYVHGHLELADDHGQPIEAGPRVALCRCGASRNKPFCDNTHAEIGFDAGRA